MGQETNSSISSKKPWYRHWLAITLMVFTFPISLPLFGIYYVWKKTTWSKGAKAAATVILFPLFLIGTAAAFDNSPTPKKQETAIVATTSSTLEAAEEEIPSYDEANNGVSPNHEAQPPVTTEEQPAAAKVVSSPDTDSAPISPPSTVQNKITSTVLYSVTKVVDGDTFKVSIDGKEETIRLIGINTPETVDPRKPVECFGLEASTRAKNILSGKKVSLEADPTQGERDKYGRLLRYAFLETEVSFNKTMISEGYAYEYTYNTPYKYQAEYKKAQAEAQVSKRGLWADGSCTMATIPPTTPAPNEQPNTVSPQPTPTPAPSPSSGHVFYTSSRANASLYYCDTDEVWKTLSAKYLKSFPSEQQLLAAYPNRKLHEPCK